MAGKDSYSKGVAETSNNPEPEEGKQGRIRREVVFVDAPAPEEVKPVRRARAVESSKRDVELNTDEVESVEEEQTNDEAIKPRSKTIWQHITTGSILTSGAVPYYRYLIAIAVMCFVSIFLTFMSLNADREYIRKNDYAKVLYERSVLMEERRYNLSSKSAVEERLEQHGVELIDLATDSRLIE